MKQQNFQCTLCKESENAIFSSKSGIAAHITHKHKVKITDKCFKMTNKKAKKSTYNPKWGKNRKIKKRGNSIQKTGVLTIPILLKIPFVFETPQISQDVEATLIDLTKRG